MSHRTGCVVLYYNGSYHNINLKGGLYDSGSTIDGATG